jgi:hypothetical protein
MPELLLLEAPLELEGMPELASMPLEEEPAPEDELADDALLAELTGGGETGVSLLHAQIRPSAAMPTPRLIFKVKLLLRL